MSIFQNKTKKDFFLPGGVRSGLANAPGRYITKAKGCYVWDQHEKRYIDYISGYGTVILGHANDEVNEVVIQQLKKGFQFFSNSPLIDHLKEKLHFLFPYYDSSLILKTGSEAVSAAIRLARAFTGKNKIVRCGFHGWHDSMMYEHISWHAYEPDPKPPLLPKGIPRNINNDYDQTILWKGDDLESLEDIFRTHKGEIASFILDPVQLKDPIEENLKEIQSIIARNEAIFILDEIKTGFRVGLQGVHGLYNIAPDITLFSKGLSNGFPLAVVLGRSEIITLATEAKIMGTYNNELLSVSAAIKTISILSEQSRVHQLSQHGQLLINGINEIVSRLNLMEDVQAVAYKWPSMPFIWFKNQNLNIKSNFYKNLTNKGVLFLPNHMNFINLSHSVKDIEKSLEAFEYAFKESKT